MNKKFMKNAIDLSLAHMAKDAGGPFGAVIVKKGKIISRGWNQVTSSNDPTAHAEMVAIRKACEKLSSFELKGATIYTSCEPCPMCLSAIYWARIDKIYYANTRKDAAKISFDDEFLYQELKKKIPKRKIPMEQIMRTEALKAFFVWKNKENKIHY